MKYTMKKTIAFLLTLVMLVNILPVSVLAEQPAEVRKGPFNLKSGNADAVIQTVVVNVTADDTSYLPRNLYVLVEQVIAEYYPQPNNPGWKVENAQLFFVEKIEPTSNPVPIDLTNKTFVFPYSGTNAYDSSAPTNVYLVSVNDAGDANAIGQAYKSNENITVYSSGHIFSEDVVYLFDSEGTTATINIGEPNKTYTVALKFYQQNSSTPETVTSLGTETYTLEATDTEEHVYTATITGSSHNIQFYDISDNSVSSLPEITSWSFKKDGAVTDTLGDYEITSTTPTVENGASVSEKVYVFEARTPRHYTVTLDYLDVQGDTPNTVSLSDTYTLIAITTKGETLSADIETDGELSSVWSDGNTYILKAQSFQIQDSQKNPVNSKLENYIITYPTNMDPDDGVYHILLHEPRPCTVSMTVLGTLPRGYDYYIVAKKNGQAYAYAPFTAATANPQFVSITRVNPEITEDTEFEVIRVPKDTSVSDGAAFENAAAYDKVAVSGAEMDGNKISWNLKNAEDGDPNYAFTVEPILEEGIFRRVHINLYNEDGETPSSTCATDLSNHKYFVRLYLYEKNEDGSNGDLIGYQNQSGWISPEEIQGADINFSNVQFERISGSINNPQIMGGNVQYNPEQHNLQVRLLQTDSNALENAKSISNPSVTSAVEGYMFKAAPHGNVTSGNTTVLNLKKAYSASYHVVVQKGESVDLDKLNQHGIKLYAEADHQSNNKDYYTADINSIWSGTGEKESAAEYSLTICDNEGNINWTNSPSDIFSGNESTKARLVQGSNTEVADGTIIKVAPEEVYVVTYPEKTIADDKETDPNNPKTVYTDYVKIEKIQVSNDYSYTSILGSGVYYGITAQYFDQGGHIQSNFAANKYYPGNIVEPDLAGNGSMIVIADPQPASDGYYLEIGGSHVEGTDTVVYMGNNGGSNKVRNISDRTWVHVVPSETEYLNESIVQPIINHGVSISNELLQHNITFEPKTRDIDLMDLPPDATIYLDGDALKDWISKKKDDGLHITKHPNQTIVFNFDSTSDIKLGQYFVRYNRDSAYEKTETPTGRQEQDREKNEFMDNLAQHIVFNCSSAKNVTIDTTVGMVLVPRSDSYTQIDGTSAGWIISNGTVHNAGAEWHSVYSKLPSSTKTNLTVGKTVDGNTPAKNQKFEFALEHLNTNHQWVEVAASTPGPGNEHFNHVQNINGAVSFNNIDLADEDIGWNVYKITENGKAAGTQGEYVTNTQTIYAFVNYIQAGPTNIATPPVYYITADEDDSDENIVLFKESIFSKSAETLAGAIGTPSGDGVIRIRKMPKPSFENEQKKSGLYFKKRVIGVGNDNDTFTFRITLTLDENTSGDKVVYKLKKTGNINAENITFKRNEGTNDFTAQVVLKRNQTANIDQIPEGVHYTIEEIKVNNKHINAGQAVDGYTIDSEHISQEGTVTPENSDPLEFINDRRIVTHFQIKKHVTGDTSDSTYASYEDEEFEFTLAPHSGVLANGTSVAAEDVPMPEGTGRTAKAKAENIATFGNIVYSEEGTYYYTITEKKGSTPYMHYDTNPVYVKVVTTQVNNKIETTVSYSNSIDGTYSTTVKEITNTYEEKTGKLTITKSVEELPDDDVPEKYEVVITVEKDSKVYYVKNPSKDLVEVADIATAKTETDAIWEVPTAANSKLEIEDLKLGYTYTVTEVLGDDVETIGNFTLTDDSETDGSAELTMTNKEDIVELTNTYEEEKGSLTVKKQIIGITGQDSKTYPITIKATVDEATKFVNAAGEFVDEDPELTVSVSTPVVIDNLPLDIEYTVAEVLGDSEKIIGNFTLSEDSQTSGSATLTRGETTQNKTITLINKYIGEKGILTVKKQITGITGQDSKTYPITIKATVDGAVKFVNAAGEFVDEDPKLTVSVSTPVVIDNLPLDIEYTVAEVLGDSEKIIGNFTLSEDSQTSGSATLTRGTETQSKTVTLINAYEEEKGSLTVKKQVTGITGQDSKAYPITIKATVDGAVKFVNAAGEFMDEDPELTVSVSTPVVIDNLLLDIEYTVAEVLEDSENIIGNFTLSEDSQTSGSATLTRGTETQSKTVTLINDYERMLAKLTVMKTWQGDDIGDDAKAKLSVTVTGTGINPDGDNKDTITLTYAQLPWTSGNLPVGEKYTVEETNAGGLNTNFALVTEDSTQKIEDLEITVNGVEAELINKYIHKVGDLTVSKTLVSDAAADADKVFEFTVVLNDKTINGTYGDMTFVDGVATVELTGGHTATATGLPVGIDFSVEEAEYEQFTTEVEGASGTIDEEDECIADFTNTRKVGDLEVSKTVKSSVGADADKKFEFTVTLSDTTINKTYGDMTFIDGVATFELKDGETATATGLPTDIEYTVEEAENTDYTVTSTNSEGTITVEGCAAEFVNARILTSVAVKKLWKDENNSDGLRPTGLTIELLADGQPTGKSVSLNAENNWVGQINQLPKRKDGKEIVYTWKEPNVVGYTLTDATTSGSLTTLTNTHEAEKTTVEVKKVWVDSGEHPADVEVQLYADGKVLGDVVKLNAGNGWKYSWNNLCRNVRENGVVREIKYTVAETKIPDGYVAKITGNASTGFVITNTKDTGKLVIEKEFDIQIPEEVPEEEVMTTDIEVVKIWDDNNNADGNRPKSITVHLLAGGKEVRTAKLTAANGWKHTFGELPKFVNGHPITYTVKEDPVRWYVSEIHGFTIRNKYQPELTSVSVRKVWDDNNNEHMYRPTSVHMTLSNGMSVILNEENGWMASITGLPTVVNGQPAEYTWTEQEVIGYKLESMETEGTVTTFTNKPWSRPDKPTEGKTPRLPGEEIIIEEYETPLGVDVIINHVGDCFD